MGECTCAIDGSARRCLIHSQEDFEAAERHRAVRERVLNDLAEEYAAHEHDQHERYTRTPLRVQTEGGLELVITDIQFLNGAMWVITRDPINY